MRPAPAASRVRPRRAPSPRRRAARPLHAAAVTAAVLLAACGGRDTAAAPDRALDRDLTLASSVARAPVGPSALGDTAATQPTPAAPLPPPAEASPAADAPRAAPRRAPAAVADEPTAVPVRRTPPRRTPTPDVPAEVARAPEPAPAPAPAAAPAAGAAAATAPGTGRSIAAGTVLAGTLGQRVCAESNRPGDRFVATLAGAVAGSGGATLPAGTPVVLEFSSASGDPPRVEFVVRGVSLDGEFVPLVADVQPVTGEVERRRVVDKAGGAAGKAVQGAVVGAVLGRVLGGGKGTVIGAAGGAAAGAAMGRGRTHDEVCLAPGAAVQVRLGESLVVR